MQFRKIMAFLAVKALLLAQPALADNKIRLQCKGESSVYENGFDRPTLEKITTERFVEIDFDTQTVVFSTFFENAYSKLKTSEGYFSFTAIHNRQYKGRLIIEEQFSINRYSGEANGMYIVDPKPDWVKGYASFIGSCEKAKRQF